MDIFPGATPSRLPGGHLDSIPYPVHKTIHSEVFSGSFQGPKSEVFAIKAKEHAYIVVSISIAVMGTLSHFLFGFSLYDQSGHAWGSDDAYISYRYALNLVNGNGLVFNSGERVEGYSNFLYTLISALFIKLDLNKVYLFCFLTNLAAYLSTLVLFFWYIKHVAGSNRAITGLFILCTIPVMWAWPASGLETSLVLLLQLALFIAAELTVAESFPLTYFLLLSALTVLLRADGFVYTSTVSTVFLIHRKYRCFLTASAFMLLFVAICTVARYSYYGDILPNTYYAKVSGTVSQRIHSSANQLAGLSRRIVFSVYLIPVGLWIGSVFHAVIRRKRIAPHDIHSLPFVSAALLAYWFYIGGDVFNERFLLVLIPFSILYFMVKLPAKWLLPFAAAVVLLQIIPFTKDKRFDYHLQKYDRWEYLGKFIAVRHPHCTLAIDAAGKTPFYSRLETIDMLGLNDRHIGRKPASYFLVGHNKYDPDYVFSRKPDLIAAWGMENLGMRWGITRKKYLSNGYILKYVLNTSVRGRDTDILDVSGLNPEQTRGLFRNGYTYFVLLKIGARP